MVHISAEQIQQHTSFEELVQNLRKGFCSDIETPMRHHHDFPNPEEESASTLLLMPSWKAGEDLGVKVVTVSPENGKYDLPSIHGLYLLFDAQKGYPKALLDGKALTAKRTAAASALASSFLSRIDASSLLMVGTGALSMNLIEAHCSVRPIKKVFVWGRNRAKGEAVAATLANKGITIEAVEDLDTYVPQVDIISCATLSPTSLIKGTLLQAGQHLDLVGSYKKDTREADNTCITKSTLFIDTYQGGLKESGDIVIPLEQGLITKQNIVADLYDLCHGKHPGRTESAEITLFKSVGHASEDLIAANYYYNKIEHEINE